MNTKYIDIHSHLNLDPLKTDEEKVIARMVEAGVSTITIGVDLKTSREAIALAEKYDFVWAGIGLHPTDNTTEEFNVLNYEELAVHPKVVCIGECGLDYFRDAREETKVRQKEIFVEHIEMALNFKKPLMIHARPSKGSMDAYFDALEILEEYKKTDPELMANFHFFVGDIGVTRRILELGFTMSFDGPITFARDYDEVIKHIPLGSIMAETDAPFAAPTPYRGKTCEPFMVVEVIKRIALIKNLPEEDVASAIAENAKRVFAV